MADISAIGPKGLTCKGLLAMMNFITNIKVSGVVQCLIIVHYIPWPNMGPNY